MRKRARLYLWVTVCLLGTVSAPATATAGVEAHDVDGTTDCEPPYVYMPEHRWRVKEPSEGTVAGNVRAVFEETSKTILVRLF